MKKSREDRKHQWGQRARMWVQIILDLSLHYDLLLVLAQVTAMLLLVLTLLLVLAVLHTTSREHPELLIVICIAR